MRKAKKALDQSIAIKNDNLILAHIGESECYIIDVRGSIKEITKPNSAGPSDLAINAVAANAMTAAAPRPRIKIQKLPSTRCMGLWLGVGSSG